MVDRIGKSVKVDKAGGKSLLVIDLEVAVLHRLAHVGVYKKDL